MNRFYQHHRDDIRFGYSCFDRLILNGCILPFLNTQRGGTIRWFLRAHRQLEASRGAFGQIAREYHKWVQDFAHHRGLDIVKPEANIKREDLVEPYFRQLGARPGVAVILKAREPERVAWYYAKINQVHVARRHVDIYTFYLNDAQLGQMFLRICPYFPFNISVWINGHNWLKNQLRHEGIAFETRGNLFTACEQPQRLQELSDQFSPADIVTPVENWLSQLLLFFSDEERQRGYCHQLFMAQVEYCHNLIFTKEAALHRLFDRLMDANRGLGHPDKLAVIFGRARVHPDTRTGQTTLKITRLRLPVISSSFKQTAMKQYVKENIGLRAESSCFQLKDLSLNKNVDNLPKVREVLNQANERYLSVQQDILSSYVDRGQLQQLCQPSVSPTGRRVPGLHPDDPRLMAVLQAMLCFAYLVANKNGFRTKDLLEDVRQALDNPNYKLSQLRYDLSKLRGKGLVSRRVGSQTYEISPEGYRIGIFHLIMYQRMYAPLSAGLWDPVAADKAVLTNRQTKLDRLYDAVAKAIDKLASHLGIAA